MDSSDRITKELLERVLRQIETNNDVTVDSFQVKPGSSHGDNYLCDVSAVTVQAVKNGEKVVYNFIAKCSPENEVRQGWLNDCNFFGKEVKMYTELIPEMISFQKSLGKEPLIPSNPKCYYTFIDGKNDIIIMENVKTEGYRMVDKRKGVDFEHSKLVMKELAKFHAISFAMKQKCTQPLPEKFPFLKESFLCEKFKHIIKFFDDTYKILMNVCRANADYCQYSHRMEKFNTGYYDTLKKFLVPQEPFAVICHGDCWATNMLFSYENDGKREIPNSINFIDLQISRYAPPTTDLAYFFYTCTTPNMRRNHLDDLLELYHTCFLNYLQHLDTEAPNYTLETLKSNFYDSTPFGYLFTCALLPTMISDPKNVPDLNNMTKENEDSFFDDWNKKMEDEVKQNAYLNDRIFGMIEELAEKGII